MDLITSDGGVLLLTCAGSAILPGVLPYLPEDMVKFANIATISTSFGTQVWVGGIAGLTMFRTLKRRTFGKVQSKLFPKYAMLNTACSMISLATFLHLNGISPTDSLFGLCEKWEGISLVAAVASSVANSLYFIPATTRYMYEVHAIENSLNLEDGVGETSPLKNSDKATDADKRVLKMFNINHGISMLIGLVSTGACGAYLYFIGKNLKF